MKVVYAVFACILLSACANNDQSSGATATAAAPATAAAVATTATGTSMSSSSEYDGATLPSGAELTALKNSCQICHSFDMVYTQRLSQKTWLAEVTKMMKWGSPLPKKQKDSVIAYLTKYLGPTVPRDSHYATATAPPESIPAP